MSQHIFSSHTSYEDYFHSLLNIQKNDFDLDNYSYIPTVKYRLRVQSSCENLKNLCGFDKFVIAILHGNQKIWLSNISSDMAISYHIYQLYHLDTSISAENYSHQEYLIPSIQLIHPVDHLYRKFIQEMYHFYTLYILVRECFEATILIYAGSSVPLLDNLEKIYQTTHKILENFAIGFLDDNIEIFSESSSPLKNLCFYQDKYFRKNVLQRKIIEDIKPLTSQEMISLHWAGYGKTAIEISLIMNISPHTVRQHLKSAIEKLNASNITHAVFKARGTYLI